MVTWPIALYKENFPTVDSIVPFLLGNTSDSYDSLPDRVTKPFIIKDSGHLQSCLELGCWSFRLATITGQSDVRNSVQGSFIFYEHYWVAVQFPISSQPFSQHCNFLLSFWWYRYIRRPKWLGKDLPYVQWNHYWDFLLEFHPLKLRP